MGLHEQRLGGRVKSSNSVIRRLLKKLVRYEYSTPAFSCCTSRRRVVEGVVTRCSGLPWLDRVNPIGLK